MARKNIRFNYFEVRLIPAQIALEYDLNQNEERDDQQIRNVATPWDMSKFLNYLAQKKDTFYTTVSLGDELAEIEKDSYTFDQKRNIYSFQVSKLRDKNIPAKKRIGEIKEEILLRDDEYIGEFTSVLYDNTLYTLMVQSNFYGLTTKQLEHVLTELRFKYLHEIGQDESDQPLVVRLAPIIDISKIDSALKADYYRKIRIKASDAMLDATISEDSLLSDVRRSLMRCTGVNIDLQITIGRADRTTSLNDEEIRKVLKSFREIPERQRPNIEVTVLDNDEAEIEVINLVEPRMTDKITVEIEPRQSIGHEFLYHQMLEKYETRRAQIARLLPPISNA